MVYKLIIIVKAASAPVPSLALIERSIPTPPAEKPQIVPNTSTPIPRKRKTDAARDQPCSSKKRLPM